MVAGRRSWWISIVFFLVAAAPGCWIPVMSNILAGRGWEHLILWVFLVPPSAGIIAPLFFAALADQRFPAERVLGVIMIAGAVVQFCAFRALAEGETPAAFLGYFAAGALISAPAWSLLTSITFNSLGDAAGRRFGSFRVWGTVGWIAAGLTVSVLGWDGSPRTGYLAAGLRCVAGGCCFLLPHTPPVVKVRRSWHEALGLGAFKLLKDRDMATYFLTAFLFSIPLVAYYSHTPRHLEALGWENVAAGMTLGQVTEVFGMLAMGGLMVRWRLKIMLLLAIACGVLRFGLNICAGATGGVVWILAGIVLHGLCWTFFFESGRVLVDRRVERGQKSQAQALLTLVQGGLGGVAGIMVVAPLYNRLVLGGDAGGWTVFWSLLTGMCILSGVVFAVGYRGLNPASPPDPGSAR